MKAQIEIKHLKAVADSVGLCVLVCLPVSDGLVSSSEASAKLVPPGAVASSVYPVDDEGVFYADSVEDFDKAGGL